MKKQFCLFTFILACKIAGAQDTLKYDKFVFKVALLNFIDSFSFKTTQAGFEFYITPKYSIDFSYGQVFGRELYNHTKGKGFKAKCEIRKYISGRPMKNHNLYCAVEGFYYKIDYTTNSEFENSLDSTIYNEDYFIKKNAWGLNMKCGFTINFPERFLIDAYGGVGIRIKDVWHMNRTVPGDKFYSVDLLAVHVRDQDGHYVLPNLTLGFKIGYVLK